MKLEENVVYVVKTRKEDEWFRIKADEAGYKWLSGHSLIEEAYFDLFAPILGYYGYKIKTKGRLVGAEINNTNDVVYVSDLIKKEIEPANWKSFCVEADSFEEALEKWKKGLTVAKEEENAPDYIVKIVGNKTIVVRKDGKVGEARCNPADDFDVVEGIRIAIDRINAQDVTLTVNDVTLLKLLKTLGAYYVLVANSCELLGCNVFAYDVDDEEIFCGSVSFCELASLKRNLKYKIDDLLKE